MNEPTIECPECKGRKNIVEWFDNGRGSKSPTYGPCPECQGVGAVSGVSHNPPEGPEQP